MDIENLTFQLKNTTLFVDRVEGYIVHLTKINPNGGVTVGNQVYLTIPAAAKLVGRHRQSVYQATWDGDLPSFDIGGQTRVSRDKLLEVFDY